MSVRRYLICGNELIGHKEGVLINYEDYAKLERFLRQNLPTLNPKYCKEFMRRAYALIDPTCSACGETLENHDLLGLPCPGTQW